MRHEHPRGLAGLQDVPCKALIPPARCNARRQAHPFPAPQLGARNLRAGCERENAFPYFLLVYTLRHPSQSLLSLSSGFIASRRAQPCFPDAPVLFPADHRRMMLTDAQAAFHIALSVASHQAGGGK